MACPVLAIFGGIDPVAALLGIGGFHAALKAAGVLHEIAVYPATPHSFFDRLASAHRKASEDAWERTLGFLRSVSKGGTSHLPRYVIVDGLAQQTVKGVTRGSPPPYTGTGRRYPPPESGGGWPVLGERREIAARGVDPERLEEFAQWNLTVQHEPPAPPSHVGCLVIKDGFIVQERYDLPRTRTWPRWIASIGKSISSCAFGRWIEAGRRGGARFRIELDSPVYDPAYLPEGFPLSDPRKEQITFSHLLTHTSGLLPEPDIKGGPEGFRYVDFTVGRCKVYPQTARLKFDPGKGYGYSSVGFSHFALMAPHLTGGMLHQEVFDRILGPIGVESAAWRLPDGWGSPYEDEQGRYMPASGGPHITTRDLARYAYLHLCDGRWEGRIVVPQWYMRQARQVVRINEVQPDNYGLGFWSNSLLGMSRDLPRDAFGFGGAGLNLVVVVPSRDLIAVRTSWVWTAEFNRVAAEFFRWVAALTH
jgi:CubicO group peptidase (beta-lactamase class C family)